MTNRTLHKKERKLLFLHCFYHRISCWTSNIEDIGPGLIPGIGTDLIINLHYSFRGKHDKSRLERNTSIRISVE